MLIILHSERLPCSKKKKKKKRNVDDSVLESDVVQKTGFDIPCKLSPLASICMKCRTCFFFFFFILGGGGGGGKGDGGGELRTIFQCVVC